VALPIFTSDPLDTSKAFQRVSLLRETPSHWKVRTETDDKNPLPLLRDTIVRRVQEFVVEDILRSFALLLELLKARRVLPPCLAALLDGVGKASCRRT